MTCLRLLAILVGLGVTLSSAAVFDNPVNEKSKQELSQVLTQVTSYDEVSGDFKQIKTIKKLNREFVSSGTFRISKKSGIVWSMQKPFVSEMTVNDSGIFERSANGTVKTISTKDNPVFAQFSKVIQAVFFGNLSELESRFSLFYEKTPNGSRIGLVPREATIRKVVANIVMEMSANLDKVVITDGEGSPVTYEFTNHKRK